MLQQLIKERPAGRVFSLSRGAVKSLPEDIRDRITSIIVPGAIFRAVVGWSRERVTADDPSTFQPHDVITWKGDYHEIPTNAELYRNYFMVGVIVPELPEPAPFEPAGAIMVLSHHNSFTAPPPSTLKELKVNAYTLGVNRVIYAGRKLWLNGELELPTDVAQYVGMPCFNVLAVPDTGKPYNVTIVSVEKDPDGGYVTTYVAGDCIMKREKVNFPSANVMGPFAANVVHPLK